MELLCFMLTRWTSTQDPHTTPESSGQHFCMQSWGRTGHAHAMWQNATGWHRLIRRCKEAEGLVVLNRHTSCLLEVLSYGSGVAKLCCASASYLWTQWGWPKVHDRTRTALLCGGQEAVGQGGTGRGGASCGLWQELHLLLELPAAASATAVTLCTAWLHTGPKDLIATLPKLHHLLRQDGGACKGGGRSRPASGVVGSKVAPRLLHLLIDGLKLLHRSFSELLTHLVHIIDIELGTHALECSAEVSAGGEQTIFVVNSLLLQRYAEIACDVLPQRARKGCRTDKVAHLVYIKPVMQQAVDLHAKDAGPLGGCTRSW